MFFLNITKIPISNKQTKLKNSKFKLEAPAGVFFGFFPQRVL